MRNRSASGANVRFHTFVFFPQQGVLRRNTCLSLRASTVRTSYLTKANTTPLPSSSFYSLPSRPLEEPLPLIPASCPSVLTCVPPYLLIYDLISTPRAHSRCVKGPLFALYGAIVLPSPLARLRLRSAFTSQRRSEEGEPEIHLSQISTNLPLILPADGLALVAFSLSVSAHAGDLCAHGPRRKSCLDVCLTAGVRPSLALS